MIPGVTNLPVPSISCAPAGDGRLRTADGLDDAVGEDDCAVVDLPPLAVEHALRDG